MEGVNSSSPQVLPWLRVEDPKAAEYLADPLRAVFLYPFIGRERTASAVAREYSAKLNAYLYQIERMLELGLLRVVRVEERKGRAVKHYRAVADAFFVPFELTPSVTLGGMVDQWSRSLQPLFLKAFTRALEAEHHDWGVRISREADGKILIAPATEPEFIYNYLADEAPAVLEGWFTDLRLSKADAKAFQHDLAILYFRYLSRGGDGRYILRVALAPMDEADLPPQW